MTVKISSCTSTEHIVRYEFEDEKGYLGFLWCALDDGRAIIDCNVAEVTKRCVKAIKSAMNEFLFILLKDFGYDEVYCETTHERLIRLMAIGNIEVFTHNVETGVPIYRVEI